MNNANTQAEILAAWLEEWRVYKALSVADVSDNGFAAMAAAAPARLGSGARPAAGSVMLLKPLTTLTRCRPVYVLATARTGRCGPLRVAPFSRFAVPATPDEVATGLPWPLAVLCLWLQHALNPACLEEIAWPVRRLSRRERLAAVDESAARRGPPLCHPLDPRFEYIDEERPLWAEIREQTLTGWTRSEPRGSGFAGGMAAEKPDNAYGGGKGDD